MERILNQLDPSYKNVIEFRHPSWWKTDVMAALESASIVFCTVNGFGLSEDLIVLKGKSYTRFHGDPPYASLYSNQELTDWIQQLNSSSCEEAWVYFNNTMHGHAIQNAKLMMDLLS